MQRGRKPTGTQAMTAAQRKQEQRLRALTRIAEDDASTWSEADCLLVLTLAKFRGRFEERDAWRRLGELRGIT